MARKSKRKGRSHRKTKSLDERMKGADDLKPDHLRFDILAYGASGTGKTTFAGSTTPRPFIFDFDDGLTSIAGILPEGANFETYLNEKGKPGSAFAMFSEDLPVVTESDQWDTLVIDSITTFQQRWLELICEENNHDQPTKHEYGLLVKKMPELFMRLSASGKHVVVTAHETMIQNEKDELWITPSIIGRHLRFNVADYFDEVYRTFVRPARKTDSGEREWVMHTTSGRRYIAKSRLTGQRGVLDPVEEQDFDKLMKKFEAAQE